MNRARGLFDDTTLGIVGALLGVAILGMTPYAVRRSSALIPGTDILLIRGDFYPRVTAAILIVVGTWLAVSSVLRRRAGRESERWQLQSSTRVELAASGLFLLGTLAYVFVVINVGFLVATALAFFVLARAMGGRLIWAAILAVSGSVAMELVFGRYFSIPLPGRLLS